MFRYIRTHNFMPNQLLQPSCYNKFTLNNIGQTEILADCEFLHFYSLLFYMFYKINFVMDVTVLHFGHGF